MRHKLKESARPKIYQSQAAAAAAASVAAAYAIGSGKQLDSIKMSVSVAEVQDGFADNGNIKDAKRLLQSSLAQVKEENSMLKGKIDEINSNHDELSKVFADDYSFFSVTHTAACNAIERAMSLFRNLLLFRVN